MAAADDGLVGVVGIQMKAPPAEDFRENVARRGDSLAGRASDTDSEGLLHSTLPKRKPAQQRLPNLQICRRPAIGSAILGSSARSKVLSNRARPTRVKFPGPSDKLLT